LIRTALIFTAEDQLTIWLAVAMGAIFRSLTAVFSLHLHNILIVQNAPENEANIFYNKNCAYN